MVLRIKKKSRKYLGNRRWGAGNIKNNRGAGDRGGVGRAGRKHKLTYRLVYERESLEKKGFFRYRKEPLATINLRELDKRINKAGANATIDLKGYKVIGSGKLTMAATVMASAFSAGALQKIEEAGGKAVTISKEANESVATEHASKDQNVKS
ncbi:MAG: uL15m family ribosomal protein [Candidatus Micrarchaeaceae archaeon]